MASSTLLIDGSHLKIKDIQNLARNPGIKVALTPQAKINVARSFAFVHKEMQTKVTYGVNTGFGPMASYILGHEDLVDLQYNLIRSHAMGMGEPLPNPFVLATMIVRLNTLAKGYSGVSIELLETLQALINARIIPIVPEHGSVGTSGDLVQLAHIGLALIGEGDVVYKGIRMQAHKALQQAKIRAHTLKPKEGLSLINGTSCMAGIAALLCGDAETLINRAVQNGVLANELVFGFSDSTSEVLQAVRPHAGQVAIAATMRSLLKTSKRQRDRKQFQSKNSIKPHSHVIDESVQEVYSLRCIPQILGPVFDTWKQVCKDVEVEINSVTDNPIVDITHKVFLHGGNFHGDYIAAAMDKLKMVMVKLGLLSERRTNFFLNPNINHGFPPFMNLKKPGLTLGLQGLQFVSTSTAADNQSLAYPHYLHSISTNGDNQDVVSMGTDCALFCAKVIENAFVIVAIETITLVQGVDVVGAVKTFSKTSQALYKAVRSVHKAIIDDRAIGQDLARVVAMLKVQ